MKEKLILLVVILTSFLEILAQNPLSQNTQVEIGVGYVQPNFRKGAELMRSYELRKNGLSYYSDNNGNRNSVGKYSTSSGYNMTIGYYKPIGKVKGLVRGIGT